MEGGSDLWKGILEVKASCVEVMNGFSVAGISRQMSAQL